MKPENRITKERICIKGGLGPFQDAEKGVALDILPITVFIGPQGTGKSLTSQLLYLFRDAEYLLAEYSEYGRQIIVPYSEYSEMTTALFRKIIEGIRGGTHGNLASLLNTPDVYVRHECEYDGNSGSDREISMSRDKDEIRPLEPFSEEIGQWLRHWFSDPVSSGKISGKAVFIPAERTFYSHFITSNPRILFSKELPLTTHEFARILIQAGGSDESLRQADDMERLVSDALGGKVVSVQKQGCPRKLLWLPKGSEQPIPMAMASSGQMSAWPLVTIAKDMFAKGELPLFLHIEEPEIHLHPKAQVAIVKLLAYLANHGIRIVVTTHSLTVLYALNNLTLAYRQLGNKEAERVPEVPVRLSPEKMAAYLFGTDGKIEKIADESGQIDEGLLGETLGDLEIEFNRLTAYKILWE